MAADLHLFVVHVEAAHLVEEFVAVTQRYRHLCDEVGVEDNEVDGHEVLALNRRLSQLNQMLTADYSTDNVWIGEVSWLKAGLSGDADRYISRPVEQVASLFTPCPVVDADLIVRAHRAMETQNTTSYSVAKPDDVARWLGDHVGRRVTHESL